MTDQELSDFNRQIGDLRHMYRNVCLREETPDVRHDKGILDRVIKRLEQLYAAEAARVDAFHEWQEEHFR